MQVAVELAGPQDDAGIRRLLREQAMPGRVRLALTREPDFSIGCAATGEQYTVVVARAVESGDVVGVACRSTRDVFLNGRECRIGYLSQLRVDGRFQGRWLVSRGFALLEQIARQDPVPLYLASIVDGNDAASGVLVRRPRRRFPEFREAATYCTLALPVSARKAADGPEELVRGSVDQVAELVSFLRAEGARYQLSTAWTEERLGALDALGLSIHDIVIARRSGRIAGVMALWDQSAYKQAVVRGYSGWLKAIAPLVLPRVGQKIRSAYASLVCVADDDAVLFDRLLREVVNLAAARGFAYLLVGLDARDPLLDVARASVGAGRLRRGYGAQGFSRLSHIAYPSRLYLASWSNGGGFHAELDDRGLHAQLDDRLTRVDLATL